jgi:hypothetical protein
VIVPGLAVQVTEGLKLPVPDTVEAHWLVWPVCRLAGLHVVVTPVMAGADTVTVAESDFVGSVAEVAVTLTVVLVATRGAVNSPVAVIVPALAVQLTPVPEVPITVAVNCWVAPDATVGAFGETVTVTVCTAVLLPPHAARKSNRLKPTDPNPPTNVLITSLVCIEHRLDFRLIVCPISAAAPQFWGTTIYPVINWQVKHSDPPAPARPAATTNSLGLSRAPRSDAKRKSKADAQPALRRKIRE